MSLAPLIAKMIAAGVPPEEAGAIAAEIYAAGVSSASVRSLGAERTRRWRHKASQIVTERHSDETSPTVTERHQPSQCDVSAVSPIDTKIKNSKRQNSERASRGTRIDPNWKPNQADWQVASDEGFSSPEIEREALRFRDYWTARAGAGGVKLDWQATWRNWIRTSAEKLGKTPRKPDPLANDPSFVAKMDSEELDAWDAYGRQTTGKSFPRNRDGGWRFPTRWPPGYVPIERREVTPPNLRSMQ